MDISVIVPSYKSEKTMDMCIKSLVSQKTVSKYEIIVVDSSPGSTVDDIVKKYDNVTFIKEVNQAQPGTARNIGAAAAKGELLVFVDSDIVLAEDWVEKAFRYYKEGHNVFTGSIAIKRDRTTSIFQKLEWFFEFNEYKPAMKEGCRWCPPTASLAVKKEVFDLEKFLNVDIYIEDAEFVVRLRSKGQTLYFNPSLKAFHIFCTNFQGLLGKAFRIGFANMRLRIIHKVSGSSIIVIRPLGLLAIPAFAVIKFVKISWRNIIYNNWNDKVLYVVSLPLTGLVIFSWLLGFYKGYFYRKS